MSAPSQRSFALRLYRSILKAHKKYLPPDMRSLGDSYVQSEFKQHKGAKAEHLTPFFSSWTNYLDHLCKSPPGTWASETLGVSGQDFSKEQQEQLKKLKDEAEKMARSMRGPQ